MIKIKFSYLILIFLFITILYINSHIFTDINNEIIKNNINSNNIYNNNNILNAIKLNNINDNEISLRKEYINKVSTNNNNNNNNNKCLTQLPINLKERHVVSPPKGNVILVCCETTKGNLNIAVHPTWAPVGANNFLNMVKSNFFSSKVCLFRSLQHFLVQFGLAGDTKIQKEYEDKYLKKWLQDDPAWQPLGPTGRIVSGVKRFQKGYLAYAGAGNNSRGTQLIIAFEDNEYLGGGSPWETPFGRIVGEDSFKTLDNIYTGYGEKVSQSKIRNRGNSYTEEEFPLLDYITSCNVTKENVEWNYDHDKEPKLANC